MKVSSSNYTSNPIYTPKTYNIGSDESNRGQNVSAVLDIDVKSTQTIDHGYASSTNTTPGTARKTVKFKTNLTEQSLRTWDDLNQSSEPSSYSSNAKGGVGGHEGCGSYGDRFHGYQQNVGDRPPDNASLDNRYITE